MGDLIPVEFTPAVMAMLHDRAGGHCEGCGRAGIRLEAHHRLFRSRGGRGQVENGLMLCGWGNHTGCHGVAHSANQPIGWALRSWQHAIEEPYQDKAGQLWMLHPDGTKTRHYPDGRPDPLPDPWDTVSAADPWAA
ncbi:HNH endonuclease [Microbacterium phage ValentiniPuff]|uniref:HNH endonuclease n=1 Tax=Microbacterium phage ValentiniPuff TaxID=2315705 RepID=A0A386KP82_9CAUD|nr:HNH endonuclease [Microbacterium phage ValentiniPuff]